LRVSLPLDIPVLDCPDDVGFVRGTQLHFDFVPAVGFGILQQQVQPACAGLYSFFVLQHQITQSQNGWIFGYARLYPELPQIRMILEKHSFKLDVSESSRRGLPS
jgi:hypothetical protein